MGVSPCGHPGASGPDLYVAVPFRDATAALEQCVGSLSMQTAPFVAVLVDDGSSSALPPKLVHQLGTDSRFELIRRLVSEGSASARRAALSGILAHSPNDDDVVVLIDGDDWLAGADALEEIRSVYVQRPATRMTFGSYRVHGAGPSSSRPYPQWVLERRLARYFPWRGHHPRSFRVGLLRACWAGLRDRFPDGRWLRGGSDQALILPMLERCRAAEVVHLTTPLYVYNRSRDDGRTLDRSLVGSYHQFRGALHARGTSLYTFVYAYERLRSVASAIRAAHRAIRGARRP